VNKELSPTSGMQHLAFSGLRSFLARISLFATGDRYSLRKAKHCIPKTLAASAIHVRLSFRFSYSL